MPDSHSSQSDTAATPIPQADTVGSMASWRPALIGIGVALSLLVLAYAESWSSLLAIWWRSDTYAHGILIAPISAFLVYRLWPTIAPLTPGFSRLGVLVLLGFSLAWWLANTAGVLAGEHLAVVGMLPALIWAMLGTRIARRIAFPLLYLFFMVPIGEGLVQPLMDFTAVFTVWALDLTGVPVLMEGRYLYIPTGNFEVEEACSGLRYLIASLALGALYAHLSYRALWRKALFILVAIIVPILANGVRAYGIVMIAHLTNMEHAVGVDHLIYGWLFFGLVMFVMFMIGGLWREKPSAAPATAPGAGLGAASETVVADPARLKPGLIVLCVAVGLVGIGTREGMLVLAGEPAPLSFKLPAANDGWQREASNDASGDEWQPLFHGATAHQRVNYRKGEHVVRVYVAGYNRQQQGAELINSANSLFDPRRWTRLAELSQALETDPPLSRRVIQTRGKTARNQISYWYNVAGIHTVNPVVANLLVPMTLIGEQQNALVIAFAVDYRYYPSEADAILKRFLEAHDFSVEALIEE